MHKSEITKSYGYEGQSNTSEIEDAVISVKNLNVWYGSNKVLSDVNTDIKRNRITAFIGPSGCGKTTLLRCLNRMNDLIESFKMTGDITFNRESIFSRSQDVIEIRRKIGMIFQQPNPFPQSIYDNMTLPIKENLGNLGTSKIKEIVKRNLESAYLYDEVSNRLKKSALTLSGGQQQRLCIARALTIDPEVILFDEPCSALDPISTMKIEDLLMELKQKYTIVIVTHNLQQASRIADYVAFFYQGEIVEQQEACMFFEDPKTELARNYISGRFS